MSLRTELQRRAEALRLATNVFKNEDTALSWLTTSNLALDNRQPVDPLETEEGFHRVRILLSRIDYGNLA